MDKEICVGIELRDDFTQACFYDEKHNEPVSVMFDNDALLLPTLVAMDKDGATWYLGNKAVEKTVENQAVTVDSLLKKAMNKEPVDVNGTKIMPVELLGRFFYGLLNQVKDAAGADFITDICVVLAEYDISLLNVVSKAMEAIGVKKECLSILGNDESFIYYVLNQKKELWKNDVFLFDYADEGLVVKRMYMHNERGKNVVMVHSDDYSDTVTKDIVNNNISMEYADEKLLEIAKSLFTRKNVSSVYLTGSCFKEEINMPEFIKFICDRRRAFAGNNLYCKGACYRAKGEQKDFVLACKQRITTGIEIKISDRGREKIFRMVRPGSNWYEAGCSYDFIVDDCDTIEVFLSPLDAREKQLVTVSLNDFPKRPARTTRINVSFSFTGDSRCHMMVKDMGFGELYKSSGIIVNEELLL